MATLKHTPATPAQSAAPRLTATEILGTLLVLTPFLLRATTGSTTLPQWDLDPLLYPLPTSSIGPALSMFLDTLVLLGAATLMLAQRARSRGVSGLVLSLAAIGTAPVLFHAFSEGGSLHDQRIGFSWMAGIFAAVAVYHAAREPAVRRSISAVLLGFLALLLIKSLHQVYLEHAQTVADFQASKPQLLAAHGWAPGSPSALAFERRLSQPEASGWFGLSNVLATLVSGLGVAAIGLGLASLRRTPAPRWSVAVVVALAASGVVCLALAGAKGGWLSFAMGVSALAVLAVLARPRFASTHAARLIAPALGPAAVITALGLVAARGLLGERLSELSLLFRWFYAQGAARIFLEHPLVGVGPSGFQSAYSLAKPPLSVEDVTSPHAIVYDWLATLGLMGAAWIALLLLAGFAAGRGAVRPLSNDASSDLSRNEARLALAIPAAATLAAAFIELGLRSPDAIVVRILGLAAWCLGTFAVLRVARDPRLLRLPLAAGAVALLAHGQIDVAASFPASAGLFLLLIGLAAAPDPAPHPAIAVRSTAPLLAAGLPAALALVVLFAAAGALGWERRLTDAARFVSPVADLGQRLRLSSDPKLAATDPSLSPKAVLADLSRAVGRPVEATAPAVNLAMSELELRTLEPAARGLLDAFELQPSDRRPLREASRLIMREADILAMLGRPDQARASAARAIATFSVDPSDRSLAAPTLRAPDFRWAANLHERRASMFDDSSDLRTAIALHAAALSRDPYNLEHALKAYRLARLLNDPAAATTWARRCLELDKLQRLDAAVKGLSDADRSEIARVVSSAPAPPAPPKQP